MSDFSIDQQWKQELLTKNDIISTISRYLPLNRKGKTHWGRCPFHHEKTPSFAVDEGKQFYHCFGCGESGDSITFVMKIESLDFINAIKMLAEHAKMEVPALKIDKSTQELKVKKDLLVQINKLAAIKYHNNLYSEKGAIALNYLEKRNISRNTIKRFGLGYSLDTKDILQYLHKEGFLDEQIREAGIADKKQDSNNFYDVFSGRLMVPIIDTFGNVIGFGGRVLEKTDFAKYRNTSSTFIFDKSKTIYAGNLLKKAKQTKAIPYILLCEGYMDVISLHQAGFETAVASMGTSLTIEQAKTLKRFCDNVIISYDGDMAGQKATLRGLDILVQNGLNVKVIKLPEGKDPDDIIKEGGAAAYQQLIEQSIPYYDFYLHTIVLQSDLTNSQGKTKFATQALEFVKSLSSPIEQEEYIRKISTLTGYQVDTLKRQLQEPIKDDIKVKLDKAMLTKEQTAALALLQGMINKEPYVDINIDFRQYLESKYAKIFDLYIQGSVFLSEQSDDVRALITDIAMKDFGSGDDETLKRKYYEGCKNCIIIAKMEKEIFELNAQYTVSGMEEKPILLQKIVKLTNQINQLKKSS